MRLAFTDSVEGEMPYRQARVVAVVLAIWGIACGATRPEERITAAEYGNEWPFTVDAITLRCGEPQRRHVIFEAVGTLYALNGSARGSSQLRDGIWKDSDQVRKADPAKAARPDIFDRPYIDVPQSLIDRGLRLCEQQR
jgi:hypothetical protein